MQIVSAYLVTNLARRSCRLPRTKIAMLLVMLAACLTTGTAKCTAAPESGSPPNIVLILADDLGHGDLSCYGQKQLKTPIIDKMADEGMRFTRHYSGSTVCAPSRCSLLTGMHTGHCTVRGNSGPGLKPEDVTIPECLKKAGYATGIIGKWGVGAPRNLDNANQHGFDYFYGYNSMWHAHNFYPAFLVRDGKKVPLRNVLPERWANRSGEGVASEKIDYAPDLITAEALQFIERNKDKPFFLYFAMNVPHANNEAGNRGMEVPDHYEFADEDWPEPEKGFAAMIRNIDRDVGKVLDKLKELGLDEKTLIIFTSDNGPHQEGGHKADFFDSNGPLRGKKRDLYEGGVRVPFIARWPGKIEPGSESDHISAFWDLLPTFCELAGVEAESKHDGISMLPTLLGKPGQRRHPFLYWEFGEQGGKVAVLKDDFKAVRLNTRKNPDGPVELYNIKEDLGEQTDIAEKNPELVKELAEIMKQSHR